jgi:thioredoxin-related protein
MRKILIIIPLIFCFLNGELIKQTKEVKVTGRPIMFIFSSDGCPYCERIKRDLKEVQFLNREAKDFDIYEIHRDRPDIYNIFGEETSTQTLQMIFKIKVTPYLVIFNSKGEKLWQIPGYSDPFLLSKVLKFTKGVDSGRFKKDQWREYLLKENLIKDKNSSLHQ